MGIVERATGRCWLEVVARRDAATLERIITAHVLPGSIIVTDTWGGYNNVANINNGMYDHQVVIHAVNFVDPVHNNVHTQTIEGLWMHAKRKPRYQSGTSQKLFPATLQSFNGGIHIKLMCSDNT